ncbi:MGMT family protein [Rhodotorula paludigena]|uniref:MGMT family protein n=1 Tax=Rhodotorula paludigena TaxID=86838 RepID=UPI003173F8E6
MPAERTPRRRAVGPASPPPEASGGGAADHDDDSSFRRDFNAAVYDCVRRIPEGKVASYGQIAKLIGHPRHSRMVGAALKALPRRFANPYLPQSPSSSSSSSEDGAVLPAPEPNPDFTPWHRVVSSSGLISPRGNPAATARQAEWLEAEGVVVRGGPGAPAGPGGGGGPHAAQEAGDAFGLGAQVQGGGRVSMTTYAWKG